jgi:2',3'-cyclic-nucleotide 2'-phosphodiesterase (5'-nucleotidase family)
VAGELKQATFLGRPITPSPALSKVVAPYQAEVQAAADRHIGARLDAPLAVRGPGGSSPLGDALIEAMKHTGGVDIAVQNRGGMRSDLPAGDLTYSQVFECMPFDNRVAVMELTRTELEAFLGVLFDRPLGGPIVSGLRVTRDEKGVTVREADGSALRPDRTYRLATNDYLALGGEGAAKALAKVPPEHIQVMDVEVRASFVDYLRRRYGSKRVGD